METSLEAGYHRCSDFRKKSDQAGVYRSSYQQCTGSISGTGILSGNPYGWVALFYRIYQSDPKEKDRKGKRTKRHKRAGKHGA